LFDFADDSCPKKSLVSAKAERQTLNAVSAFDSRWITCGHRGVKDCPPAVRPLRAARADAGPGGALKHPNRNA
jgi:hypothetical protein